VVPPLGRIGRGRLGGPVAQGVANIVTPLFGGIPATGAIARTATNIRSGAQSPVAGMIHAATLLCILLFAAPLVSYVPMAALAGILMVVAYNMGEWREIPELLRLSKADIAVWLSTFALTVFADLTVAVEVGMVLAALLFIRRVAETTTIVPVTDDYIRESFQHSLHRLVIPSYVRIFRIHGPFLFGATHKLRMVTEHLDELPEIVVLRLRNMTAIDATGLHALERRDLMRFHMVGRLKAGVTASRAETELDTIARQDSNVSHAQRRAQHRPVSLAARIGNAIEPLD
jgi:SulP family sulfate permease